MDIKERDGRFQRAMQELCAEARTSHMTAEEFDRRRTVLFNQCYADVDKLHWPSQFD